MRRTVDPGQLWDYLRQLLKLPTSASGGAPANVNRLFADRFFQGTITSVMAATQGYRVMLKRTGDTASDGNTYLCVTPGYTPAIGHVVECIWRDMNVAYVLWRIA